jgi:hypothetical protein
MIGFLGPPILAPLAIRYPIKNPISFIRLKKMGLNKKAHSIHRTGTFVASSVTGCHFLKNFSGRRPYSFVPHPFG